MKMRKIFSLLIALFLVSTANITTGFAQDSPQPINTLRHPDSVWSVAFSPDGNTLASGSWDRTVYLWDPHTATLKRTLPGRPGWVYSVAFSPDGNTLASGSDDGTVYLWDPHTATLKNTLTGHTDFVWSVAFSPDGDTLASGSWDDTVRLWDVETGDLIDTFTGHTASVHSVAFSPDGNTLASGSWDRTVRLWDPHTATLKNTLGHTRDVHSVAFSPDGNTLTSVSDDGTVRLWDPHTATLKNTLTGHTDSVWSVAFSPDGNTLASGSGDGTVRLWDPHTATLKNTLTGHIYFAYSIAFSPDGTLLASGGRNDTSGTVLLWPHTPTSGNPLTFDPSRVDDQTFEVGTPVNVTLPSATGGTSPYTYILSPIPAGLQFDTATQVLSGTPTTATPATSVTYTATDATGASASLTFTITVTDAAPADITFIPNAIDDLTLTVNTPMDPLYLPLAEGGTSPYTYTLDPIPVGLSFDAATQLLSGTPTTVGTTAAIYTATDATGVYDSLTFSIEVIGDGSGGGPSDADEKKMYWTDYSQRKIQRADLDGTNIEDLITSSHGLGGPAGLALDVPNRKMYWVEGTGNASKIRRADLDGTNIEDLITSSHGLNFPQNIAVDVPNRKMYWTDEGSIKVQRADLDGTNIEDLITSSHGLGNPEGIALDVPNRKMYWTDEGSIKIQRANLDGTNIEDLITSHGLGKPQNIALDVPNRKIYWTEQGSSKIRRANLDGTNIEDLITSTNGLVRPVGIALDMPNRKIYWTDPSTSKIQRANLDGTNIEDLITSTNGLVFPYGFAFGSPQPNGTFSFNPSAIPDQTFTVGTVVSLTLPSATGGTAPYTYALDLIPAGLQFDATTQVLSGIPTTVTPATPVTYTVTDAAGQTASLTFTIEVTSADNLDVNGDGQVTVIDLAMVALFYGTRVPTGVPLAADVNADGVVNLLDLTAVAQAIDAAGGVNGLPLRAAEVALLAAVEQAAEIEGVAGAPMGLRTHVLSGHSVYANVVAALVDVKHLATGDVRLGKAFAVLSELLQLLAELTATPETTALLANYPNPFNPETWIPYHLATDAEVQLTIYNVRGDVVRALIFGHQAAGVYERRGRAAYWDGKNAVGEPVASGVYFYTFTAGDFTATRKMLIQK